MRRRLGLGVALLVGLLIGFTTCAVPPVRAADEAGRVGAYYEAARALVQATQSAVSVVDGRALGGEQKGEVRRELELMLAPVRQLAAMPRTLGQEVERYVAWSGTRRGRSAGLRELRYQSVLVASERQAAKLEALREALRRAPLVRLTGPSADLLSRDREVGDLVRGLWGLSPVMPAVKAEALERIVIEDQALVPRILALKGLLERVMGEVGAP